MLICNNCFTIHEEQVESCDHCHMRGNFSYREDDDEGKPGASPLEVQRVSCLNCGSNAPGEGDKCIACHFPLPASPNFLSKQDWPASPVVRNGGRQGSITNNLKAG